MSKTIRRLLITLSAGVLAVLAIPATSLAAANGLTDVSGTVSDNNGPVSGASVTVVCNHNTLRDKTGKAGVYLVQFTSKECPANSPVTVVATKGNKGGTNQGSANPLTTRLNVALVNVSIVPELGAITGGAAAVAGAGAFIFVRRRQLG